MILLLIVLHRIIISFRCSSERNWMTSPSRTLSWRIGSTHWVWITRPLTSHHCSGTKTTTHTRKWVVIIDSWWLVVMYIFIDLSIHRLFLHPHPSIHPSIHSFHPSIYPFIWAIYIASHPSIHPDCESTCHCHHHHWIVPFYPSIVVDH